MREAHCHIALFGESLSHVRLEDCRGVDECLERIRAAASEAAGNAWIRAVGARIEGWSERRWPTLSELDRASAGLPCVILSFDYHAALANTPALAAGRVRAGEPVPPNGVVCIDERTGGPTGLLLEQAAYQVWGAAPEPTEAQRQGHVLAALRRFGELGYREVHDLHSPRWLKPLLRRLESDGLLPVDSLWLYPPVSEMPEGPDPLDRVSSVRTAGAKVFVDGTLNSRTALMLHEYRDAPPDLPRGRAMLSERQLDESLRAVWERLGRFGAGHLAAHAIGDGAVRMVLDAIERTGLGPDGLGITARIEHCELIDATDTPRFAELGVVASVQPCHLLADVEALRRYLPHRLDRVLPLRELIDSGLTPGERLWFGSDAPIVRPDPGDSIQAAVHRRREGMPLDEAIAWEQRTGIGEAWAAFGAAAPAEETR